MEPLWADLINSDWHDHLGSGAREDRLDNDLWLASFLDRCGWSQASLPAATRRQSLRKLRRLLRRMVDDLLSGSSLAPDDLKALNRALASAPVIRQLDGGSLQLVPTTWGISAVAGTIAASFADLLAHGDPARIVTCANPDCRWVMLDESRNRSRKWCDKAECGNVMKVRKHRQKKRALHRPEKTS